MGAAAGDGDRVLARALDPRMGWIVRESRPEVGFSSVEVAAPWLAGAVGGVNEAGLSALNAAPSARPSVSGVRAAPAWLLVQECLQRFDSLHASIEWCLRRPSGGTFSLLLADASGEVAVVDLAGGQSKLVHRGPAGVVAGGEPRVAAALRERLDASKSFERDWPLAASGEAPSLPQLWLRPGQARLEWLPAEGEPMQWRVRG